MTQSISCAGSNPALAIIIMENKELTEEDWKIVEARLQQDIDNGKGDEIGMMFLGDTTLNQNPKSVQEEKE